MNAECLICGGEATTAFGSFGRYHGTRFDPEDREFLEIWLCDECLTTAANNGRICHIDANNNARIWSV